MSGAPTPAPHVPVSFLLAGGSAAFSADCVKAFMQCNIHPDMIGSHGAVAARTAEARRTVETYERAVREGRERIPPEPTFAQRWMASSTAGHLTQDAAHRRGGSGGNHCATLVDGYTYQGAPAMATLGRKDNRGTVEADVSALEERQAAALRRNNPGTDAYPNTDRERHERERVAEAVRSQQRNFPRGLNNTPMNTDPIGSPHDRRAEEGRRAAVNRAGSAATGTAMASPSAPTPAAAPGEATVPVVNNTNKHASPVDQAIECLNNYLDAMRQPDARRAAIDQEIARQNSDPAVRRRYEEERTQKDGALATAQRQEARAVEARNRAQEEVNRETIRNNANPPLSNPANLARAQGNLQRADEGATTAAQRTTEAQARRNAVEELRPEAQVACLQERRARVGTSGALTTGRIPGEGEEP